MAQNDMEQTDIGTAEPLEPMFKGEVYATEQARWLGLRLLGTNAFFTHEHVDEDWNERAREHVRRKHGENDGQGLRGEQVFGHIGQEYDRDEGTADCQGGDQGGLGDPCGTLDHRTVK